MGELADMPQLFYPMELLLKLHLMVVKFANAIKKNPETNVTKLTHVMSKVLEEGA